MQSCWRCWHPIEILIIVGAALGAFMTSNPPKVRRPFAGAWRCRKVPRYKRDEYVDLLKLVYDILVKMRKEGLLAIEADVENPKSALFKKYPKILDDHHMVVFITDCLRLIVGGTLDPHELESLLEYELETHHKEAHEPAHAVQKVADALPGFGIVAAVLGIVNTMGAHRRRGHRHHRRTRWARRWSAPSSAFSWPMDSSARSLRPWSTRPTKKARPSKW